MNYSTFITTHKRSLQRLCFYTCLSVHMGGYPSMPCRSQGWVVVFQHALQFSRGGSPGPHPGGRLRGLAGGVSRPTTRGVSRPTPRGELGSLARGVSRPTPRGVSRPTTRGVVSQHALRQTPSQLMATAAGGTHPTGMHSCLKIYLIKIQRHLII